MQIQINNLKILSPSPTNFILQVDQTISSISHVVTYIGSAEYCFDKNFLRNSKIAHSTTFSKNNSEDDSYAIFDLNDLLIGVNTDYANSTYPHTNYLIAPTIKNVDEKLSKPINGIVNNKNAFIGVANGSDSVTNFLSRIYKNPSNIYYEYESNKDSIILYNKKTNSDNIKNSLRLDKNNIIPDIEQLFVIQTFPAFNSDGFSLNARQSITGWSNLINDFDNGILSAASFITPKQTLNTEYSTIKKNIDSDTTTPFDHMRSYNLTNLNMYASGNMLIFNYLENRYLDNTNNENENPLFIDTEYSRQIGLTYSKEDVYGKNIFKEIKSKKSLNNISYKNYLPEIVNVVDDGFGGIGKTGDHGSKRAIHKANIFDIDISNLKNGVSYENVIDEISENVSKKINQNDQSIKKSMKRKMYEHISKQLQEVVSEIIPAHTHLFKVKITED